MKILHLADVHLSSKVRSGLVKISEDRKSATRKSFTEIINYAEDNGIKVVILAGDIFDTTTPSKKERDFFENLISKHPGIDFLYLRGNHDSASENIEIGTHDNLKTFGNDWTTFSYGDVDITGVNFTPENCDGVYSGLNLDKNRKNILVLHGSVGKESGTDKVNLSKLAGKGIDYLALGHIHKPGSGKVDDRGTWAYSGCVEGKAFDEDGEKGFIVYDTDTMKQEFIPHFQRRIKIIEKDISSAKNVGELTDIINKVTADKSDIVRLVLKGEVSTELEYTETDVRSALESKVFFLDVKDETVKKTDISKYEHDRSLRGDFVRSVYDAPDLTPEQKNKIICLGLGTLDGREMNI